MSAFHYPAMLALVTFPMNLQSAGKVEKVDQTRQSEKADAEPGNGAKHHSVDNAANDRDRIAMEEEDIHEIGEEEREKLNDVDYLTGNPLPNDILIICARLWSL
ncbi:hypothetical protein HAX54_043626 [Datura stramonium]|uniref:Uncharacterized protein n=1 Tax=Datura stramonium TaxID=4076 RepID=A0ABS8W1B9_DATST|nr:hypothetical protein [Datura stramonium]